MTDHLFFYIGLSFLLTHEMDAIRRQEYRIFPITSLLSERTGYLVFTALHVPLYVVLFWGLTNKDPLFVRQFILYFDVFMLVHIGLHLLALRHKLNQFTSFFSWSLIVGAGLFGLFDLLAKG